MIPGDSVEATRLPADTSAALRVDRARPDDFELTNVDAEILYARTTVPLPRSRVELGRGTPAQAVLPTIGCEWYTSPVKSSTAGSDLQRESCSWCPGHLAPRAACIEYHQLIAIGEIHTHKAIKCACLSRDTCPYVVSSNSQ